MVNHVTSYFQLATNRNKKPTYCLEMVLTTKNTSNAAKQFAAWSTVDGEAYLYSTYLSWNEDVQRPVWGYRGSILYDDESSCSIDNNNDIIDKVIITMVIRPLGDPIRCAQSSLSVTCRPRCVLWPNCKRWACGMYRSCMGMWGSTFWSVSFQPHSPTP